MCYFPTTWLKVTDSTFSATKHPFKFPQQYQPHRSVVQTSDLHAYIHQKDELQRPEADDISEVITGPTPWVSPIVAPHKHDLNGWFQLCLPNTSWGLVQTIDTSLHSPLTLDWGSIKDWVLACLQLLRFFKKHPPSTVPETQRKVTTKHNTA